MGEIMNIFDELRMALREKYDGGMTQREIAEKSGLSQSHVCKLLNGTRSFSEVTLGNVLKLFPRATLLLKTNIPTDEFDEKLIELSHSLSQSEKLDLIVHLSRMTAAKSTEVASNAEEKIG